LHLKIPEDYPHSPPKAAFRTKIWHPNVDEQTGSVCVDTLKKDWTEKLTLRDVLVTISCLLIHPNPDSALNATAGSMLQADYQAYFNHAKLMTAIHAKIPTNLKEAVLEAKRRGEDPEMIREELEQEETRPSPTKTASTSSVIFKKRPHRLAILEAERSVSAPSISTTATTIRSTAQENAEDSENDENDEAEASKENDPSLSPSPVEPPTPSPRKNLLGKRPLAVLPTPIDHEGEQWAYIEDDEELSANQANIANNTHRPDGPPLRKSPKLSERLKGVNAFGRILIEEGCDSGIITPFIDDDAEPLKHAKTNIPSFARAINEKENAAGGIGECKENSIKEKKSMNPSHVTAKQPASRITTSTNSSNSKSSKSKPKTGLRRL
jgi:ubiquitin-conjugating enzyme E2 S